VTKVYIIRHCEAEGNLNRIFQGHTNGNISPNGQLQLDALSKRFEDINIDFIYSSPLQRTLLTAKAACNDRLEIKTDSDLIEINGGKWEGELFASFPEKFPGHARLWNLSPHLFTAPDGESMESVRKRMHDVFQKIVKNHDGQTGIIVSHGCAIRNLLCVLKGYPFERLKDIRWCDNTAVTLCESDGETHNIIFESDLSHAEHLSTLKKQKWWTEENRKKLYFE